MMILVTVEVQILQHCPDSLEHSPATANFAGEKLKFIANCIEASSPDLVFPLTVTGSTGNSTGNGLVLHFH
jgi:hypothetical protein